MNNSLGSGALPVQHTSVVDIQFFLKAHANRESTPEGRAAGMHATAPEEFIGTVDVWQLKQLRWPIMRALTPGYVDHLELNRYLKGLLATGRWTNVHAVPHNDPHHPYPHLFDVYGQPT